MNNIKKTTVVDLNAGIGERAFSFIKAGFQVLAVTESIPQNADICRSVLSYVSIIEKTLDEITPEEIPEMGVLSSSFLPSRFDKKPDYAPWNKTLSDIIMYHAPKILLL